MGQADKPQEQSPRTRTRKEDGHEHCRYSGNAADFLYKHQQAKLRRRPVRFASVVICSKCQQPIVSGEAFGFIYLNTAGKESYSFFHRRIEGRGCWEAYLNEGKPA